MDQISYLICTVLVIFFDCLPFVDLDNDVLNVQTEVKYLVHKEPKSPDIVTFDTVLELLRHQTLKRRAPKNMSMADEDGTNSETHRNDKYNQSVDGKDGQSSNLVELSDGIVQDGLTGEVTEDEGAFLGFSEKERHDGFKRSSPEEYPYAVLIYVAGRSKAQVCSGTLITASWVLTAAHCFIGHIKQVIVYAGGNSFKELHKYTETRLLQGSAQVRVTLMFYKHPRYSERNELQYDVAVVKVSKKFRMTRTVKTVSLYRRQWGSDSYKPCVLTGFGQVFHEKGDPADNTRKTHYLEVRRGCPCDSEPLVEENMMCSRPREDYGVCSGDSGGGLVCGGRVVAVAKAILTVANVDTCNLSTATTYECGLKNTLSIFQDVVPYLSWIDSKINNARTLTSLCPLVLLGVLFQVVCMN